MDDRADALPENIMFWDKHRYLILVVITIGVSLFLVGIGLALYNSSGAAQLDLSRPGYKAVSSQAVSDERDIENYPSFGEVDQAAITEFKTLYEKHALKAKAVDAFNGDPLNADILEISAPTADTQETP